MEEESIRHFEDRKIALTGDKRMCRHFYLQFHAMLNIQYYFFTKLDRADGDAETFFKEITGIECRFMKTSAVFEEDLLLILCTDHALRKAYDQMFFLQGLEWGPDYIDALYVVQYYRHKDNMDLSKKNLWIFGAGNNGEYFYQRYKKAYSIKGFISNFEEEKEYQGLPVIRPQELSGQNNIYVVISSDADTIMSEKLCELGFIGNENFCFPEMIPKRLFHAVGTCQVIYSAELLFKNPDFYPRYYGCSYFDNIYDPCCKADNRRLKGYGRFCDVVFYNVANAGTTEFRNYKRLIDHDYKNAMQLFMPFYYFKGQMMQATDTVNPYGLRSYGGQPFWFRGDQEVNHMVEQGYKVEEIVKEVLKEDYWTEQEILSNFKYELKKIEVLDRFSSFPIKEFIEENYQKVSVFVDGTHFNHLLYLYVANQIADVLQIEQITNEDMLNEKKNQFSIMPVYPCVQRALNMEPQSSYPFFNIKKESVEYLDIEEYIRRYTGYVMDVCNMRCKTGTDWR